MSDEVRPAGADRVIGAGVDLGINFFDTADVYGILSIFDALTALPVGASS